MELFFLLLLCVFAVWFAGLTFWFTAKESTPQYAAFLALLELVSVLYFGVHTIKGFTNG